ncbi:MAG: DUF4350 domain-containing protein [Verrucomicrobiota bacterium]|jgi:hypothetical protein
MLKSRHILAALLALSLAGFAFGLVWLFQMRFDAGDIYPPYSSLRTDPLGVKAFYEALQNLPGLSVTRFFQRNSKLHGGPQRVLFLLGTTRMDLEFLSPEDDNTLQNFLLSGGRIVISLLPSASLAQEPGLFLTNSLPPSARTPPKRQPPSRDHTNSEPLLVPQSVSLLAKIGLGFQYDNLSLDEDGRSRSELAQAVHAPPGLPPLLSWHSGAYFEVMDTNWQTLYQRKNHPVILQRPYGAGSLVLSTDSYFLSNEALRRERHPELLAWLVGPHRDIIFDETHLGVEERPGVAGLMRQYHLQGVLLALALLAALFIWKNSLPLVPPLPAEPDEGPGALVRGKEASAGFASLLRRGISPADILFTCFAEWKSACARQPRAAARLPAIEKIMEDEKSRPPLSRHPVETWQTIQKILTERK